MDALGEAAIRTQLLDRRQRLETSLARTQDSAHLNNLLQEVDSALKSLEGGTYGKCDVCHEPIEQDWLSANPLATICLTHLSPDQQRAFEHDLELASQIQRTLLPKPQVNAAGWDIHYDYQPAGPVSGDYCDLLHSGSAQDDFYFLLGDVSGKGVAAALLMSHLHAIFRSLVNIGLPVDRLVERANRLFFESTLATQFATLVCGRADRFGEVELCNAGHCLPLWVRGTSVTALEATGLPLGIFCNGEYSMNKLRLADREMLVLFSDGFSEARNETGEEYGVERLRRLVAEHQGLSAKGLIAACLEDLNAFQAGAARTDDLTLMAMRRTA